MSDYTSIQISKNTKEKLDLCKGLNNLSYNKIIERLLEQSGGVIVEDVVEIQREQTAFSLKYWDKNDNHKVRDISYVELMNANVGDMFYVVDPASIVSNDYVTGNARVMAKWEDDVILLITETSCNKGVFDWIKSVVHISLF